MKSTCDILIVGGGASGLFAAITAAETAPYKRIIVLERDSRVAKKLLTTGNGRCNFTNGNGLCGHYTGDVSFAETAFAQFGVDETCRVMARLGIPFVELEDGKRYPRSLQASSVVDMLRYAAVDAGVEIVTEASVTNLQGNAPFIITTDRGIYEASQVMIATGGKSCVGNFEGVTGYDLLQKMGHSITKLTPAIVQLTTEKEPIKPLAGIKVEGAVTACCGNESRTETGEILFTEYGISGPPVLQVSGLIARYGKGLVNLDLIPDLTVKEIETELHRRRVAFGTRTCEDLLTGFVNKRLGQTLLKLAGVEKLSRSVERLTTKEIKTVANLIKNFSLNVTGTKGWNAAQVTCGGIRTVDFNPKTMESNLHKGLFAAGEVLNVTGDCGGFNLQWAWTSGYLAGIAMGEA
ncbi:MAG: NAD(P)/FAD-dependent oxidoreductase [Clostridia bacterium]|nr:NAD(P)/FAD-dependent oxidoreductase [Clostridia bacterium]